MAKVYSLYYIIIRLHSNNCKFNIEWYINRALSVSVKWVFEILLKIKHKKCMNKMNVQTL